jgi:methyl-accepting chemotaxis protein
MPSQHQQGVRVKNLPIVGKILVVLGMFGVFVVAVAFCATGQVRSINSDYTHLIKGSIEASDDIAQGNADIQAMEAHIAQLTLVNTASETQADLANLAFYKSRLTNFDDQAAAAYPTYAADLTNLKARTLQVIDGDCASSIKRGASATTAADTAAAQAAYVSECERNSPLWFSI